MKRWIIGILLGGLLLSGCDRVTYVNIPTQTTDSTSTPASTVSGPTTKPTETKAPTLPTVTSKPTTAPSEPDRTEPPVTRPPETEPPATEPAPTTAPTTAPTEPVPTTEPTTAPTEPEPTTEPTTAPTEPPREDTLFYALVYGVDGRRSAAGLPALKLDDTLRSEAAMAIQHYLSTGASPVGCTVVALDPALTDGEMVELFLTLCGDETILSEAYTRYGVALTSDNGVYYAAGFFV